MLLPETWTLEATAWMILPRVREDRGRAVAWDDVVEMASFCSAY